MAFKNLSFVAYTGRDKKLSEAIIDGVRKANAVDSCPFQFESWEFNDIGGKALVSPIIKNIEDSHFVVADITYLNPNVVYEIGLSIGRKKKVLLIRNSSIEGDKHVANSVGIFDTIGYRSYSKGDDLRNILISHIDADPLPFQTNVNSKAPVYVLPSNGNEVASTSLIARIKKAKYRYRSFLFSEGARMSAIDTINQVGQSAGIAVMLDYNDNEQMVRSMFVAGLADGMNKPLLLLAPFPNKAPLDIRDHVQSFRDPADIAECVAEFCPDINAKLQESAPPNFIAPNLLGQISVGDPTAENEMTTLENYYLKTDQYLRASRGEVNLVVGRKGSGKTALFIRVRDMTRSDKRNIVVDLKPESYQLLKLKDEILEHLAEGSRQHLITAFWEYLILLEVTYKLLEKDQQRHKYDHELTEKYERLENIYYANGDISKGDFSERVMQLSAQLSQNFEAFGKDKDITKVTNKTVTETLYQHNLKDLKDAVSEYLKHKERVLVLFDNLDKSWSTIGVDKIDAITLRCLIDAGRKVERDMQRQGHVFRCVVFVRNDVYQHLMENSPDYGKEMRAVLDWSDPDMLREMLRLRLISNLDEDFADSKFSDIWSSIAESHVFGEESSSFVIERSLMRPRNVLKLFSHARGFSVNFKKEKIDQDDFYKGLRAYSQDLLVELDRELGDVYPEAKDLLYYFIATTSILSNDTLKKVVREAGIPEERYEVIRDFLIYHGVLGLHTDEKDQYIFDFGYDLKQITIRINRLGGDAQFVMNPAFIPALDIQDYLLEKQDQLPL